MPSRCHWLWTLTRHHDCKWTSRKCNCSMFCWYQRVNAYRRPVATRQIKAADWMRLFGYLCHGQRRVIQVRVGDSTWRYPVGFPVLPDDRSPDRATQGPLAAFYHSWEDCRQEQNSERHNERSSLSSLAEFEGGVQRHDDRPERRNNKARVNVEEIIRVILDTSSCPLERVFRIGVWLQNYRYRNFGPHDRVVDTALSTVKMMINKWAICEFMEHYSKCTPLFYAERYRKGINTISIPFRICI